MQKTSVWFLLSLACSLSSARKQREWHAPLTYSQDDINVLSQGLLQLGMELKMQVSYSKNRTGHLFKQLDTLNTSLAELLTQVSQQERKDEDLERRAEQLDKRNEGLRQLVAELQHQLVAGMQYREKFSERLELLERKMEDAVLPKADGLSLTQVMDDIMVSRSLLIILVDYYFIGNEIFFNTIITLLNRNTILLQNRPQSKITTGVISAVRKPGQEEGWCRLIPCDANAYLSSIAGNGNLNHVLN